MTVIERIKDSMKKIKVILIKNKKVVIASFTALIVSAMITLNINLIQVVFFKMNQQTESIVQILDKNVLNQESQESLYFRTGMDYVLSNLDEDGQKFINDKFDKFNKTMQITIIETYNKEKLLLQSAQPIIDYIAKGDTHNAYRQYIQRIDIEAFERELARYFGKEPEVTQDMVNALYRVMQLKNQKLPMEQFSFSVYELMSFPHKGDASSVAIRLLGYFEPEQLKNKLFEEMKVKPIDVDLLQEWVEVLSNKNIITTEEYTTFVNNYNGIKRVREENKNLLIQEVDLINVKGRIEVETNVLIAEQDKIRKEIEGIQSSKAAKESELRNHTNYKSVEVYILDQYPNGEYEAAVPEKSWLLGTYKPGDHRMRVKTTRTTIDKLGIWNLEVYVKGSTDNGLPYYVEVSAADKALIKGIQDEIAAFESQRSEKAKKVDQLGQEVEQIRKANNYQQTVELLDQLIDKKEQVQIDLNKYQVEIQNLFGIGDVIVSL